MDFNLTLAREKSKNNPVYYVQYAHARACQILARATEQADGNLALLTADTEQRLMRRILALDDVLSLTLSDLGAHRFAGYTYELARDFTTFYETERVIGDDAALSAARLRLVTIAKGALATSLELMGISAPEQM